MTRIDQPAHCHARRLAFAGLVALLAIPSAAIAQVPGAESFVRPLKTPLDFWEVADFLVRTGRPKQAVPFLQKFEAANPDDATLLDLRDQYGDGSVLRLADDASTRPFANRLIKRMAEARRKDVTRPERIASAVSALSKSREERNLAVERLRDAGPYAVPPLLKAASDPATTPEARDAIVGGLGSLDAVAIAPLVAALDGPPVAVVSAIALGRLGDPSAIPPLTAVASSPSSPARDAARRAIAAITGVAYEAQPKAPVRLLTDAAWAAHRAVAHLPDEPSVMWVWDDATKSVVARPTTHRVAESDAGLRLAKAAIAIAPGDREAQVALLSLAFDRDPAAAGPVALATGPGILEEVARRAIADGRNGVAADAIRTLGKVTDRKTFADGARPGILVDALTAPDRRIQFAAAEAIVGLEPKRTFAGSSLIVPTLARFITPTAIPRAVVIDGNAARGSQVVGYLKLIGYDAQLAQSGDAGFRLAAEMADVELIAIDPHFVQGHWNLHDTLSNLRADARTAGIPLFLYGPMLLGDKFAGKLDSFPDVQFFVSPTETRLFKNQVDRGLAAVRARPLSADERNDYATRAAVLLARIATKPGHPFEPDLAMAGPALSIALNNPATAPAALKVLADIPKAEAQRNLADTLINPSNPPDLRLAAAEGLAKSVRHFGPLLAPDQEVKLVAALDREADPALKTAIATVVGALKPKPAASAKRLQAFRPTSVAR